MSIGVSFVISIKNLRAGFQRCYDQIVDISIDVPQAYNILDRWVLGCRQARIINDDIVKKMPCRGRKRFVSEGDGGLIKDSSYFWWKPNESIKWIGNLHMIRYLRVDSHFSLIVRGRVPKIILVLNWFKFHIIQPPTTVFSPCSTFVSELQESLESPEITKKNTYVKSSRLIVSSSDTAQ